MRARCSTPARTGPKRARHYARYLELATQAERRLFTHAEAEWLGRLETEIDNMRAALDWSLGCEPQLALRLAGALGPYWEVGYRGGEGLRWIQAALEAAGPAAPIADRARGVIELANVLALEDRLDDAIDAARRAVTLARESSDDALIADALVCLSEFAKQANDELEEIRPLAIEALARANSAGDERLIAWALMARANTLPPGDQAEREYHEAAAALRTAGDRWHLGRCSTGRPTTPSSKAATPPPRRCSTTRCRFCARPATRGTRW